MGRGIRNENIYALYRGDEYIMDGTLDEIAHARHVKRNSVQWMLHPSYLRRCALKRKNGKERVCLTLTLIEEVK